VAAFQPTEVEIKDEIPIQLADGVVPRTATMAKLTRHGAPDRLDGLFVGNPTNPGHLIDFWNVRACGWNVAFWSEQDPEFFSAAATAAIGHMGAHNDEVAWIAVWRPRDAVRESEH